MGEQSDGREPISEAQPASEFGAAWTVVGILLSGMLTWGGIGWLVDQWLNTGFLLPTGLILGSAAGFYLAYKRLLGASGQSTGSTKPDGDE